MWIKFNEIQFTQHKMDLNNRKINYSPSVHAFVTHLDNDGYDPETIEMTKLAI